MAEDLHYSVGSLHHVTVVKKDFPGVILSENKLFQHFFTFFLSRTFDGMH